MKLDFREFMTALSVTQRQGPAAQLKWAFEMYDMDGSGEISMFECTMLVKVSWGRVGPGGGAGVGPAGGSGEGPGVGPGVHLGGWMQEWILG